MAVTTDPGPQWPYPGARWWKFDFHTHTPASADYGKGLDQASLHQLTHEDWLLNFMRAKVDCVAVTDHNSGEWIDPLKKALRELKQRGHPDYRPLTLFPGVEITANGGIHILGLLDIGKATSDISALLGAVGYAGSRGKSDAAADSAPIKVVEAISKAGGIPILAHVDGPAGAWQLKGNTLAPLLDHDGLFCMEVVDPNKPRPELYRSRKLTWAEVLGSDSHHPNGTAGQRFPGSHYTWVKMAQPSLEGLRLALLDGERFSIRRSDGNQSFAPFALPNHRIEAIEIRDARFVGKQHPTRLEFSPWLNALIGGRGTGKSTMIYALRIVSQRESELADLEEKSTVRLTFDRFNRVPRSRGDDGGLNDETEVIWTVMRNNLPYRVRWKSGEQSIVEELDNQGNWSPAEIQSIDPGRFPLSLFNQGQIAELAGESQLALLRVVDDAAGVAPQRTKLEDACKAFYATQARIREIDAKLARKEKVLIEKKDVELKLGAFEADHSNLLTDYRRRDRQDREAKRQFSEASGAAGRIEQLAETLQLDDLPTDLFPINSDEDRSALNVLAKLSDVINKAKANLLSEAQKLQQGVKVQQDALTNSAWQTALNDTVSRYNDLIASLQAQGVGDPGAHSQLMQDRRRIEMELQRLDSERSERQRLVSEANKQLEAVLQARRDVSKARENFLNDALSCNEFVRITSRAYGNDPRTIERSLRDVLSIADDRFQQDILDLHGGQGPSGVVSDLLKDLPNDAESRQKKLEARIKDLKDRIEAACKGSRNFRGFFNNYLERKFQESPEFLDRLLTWFPEDGLDVQYSQRGDGRDFQPITQASAGQRSAAMLAFLLAHGEDPLVLDQPEDDLDNHLIYHLVVRQLRENKTRRQIIVVTHNPNVVVNGDAEMLHAFHFVNGQCAVDLSGSLQDKNMREEVCEIMEGGREAFGRRYRRLA